MKAKTWIQVCTVLLGMYALASLATTILPGHGLALAAGSEQLLLVEEDGHIDSLEANRIVINDSSFTLTTTTLFFNTQGGKSERSAFTANTFVHYAANNNREILSLRSITHATPPPVTGESSSTTGDQAPDQEQPPVKKTDKLIFENGVWHN